MAILQATDVRGTVAWLGLVPERAASLRSEPVGSVAAEFAGLVGESHSGLTRPSCSRVTAQYPVRGTPIRNTRQISLVSVEELEATAAAMGIPELPPEWVGANLVLEGVPMLTLLPPAARLVFAGGVVLTVDVENAPCRFPAREIDREHPGLGGRFVGAATGRRGLTAWVEREGAIVCGEAVRVHAAPQRLYPPLTPGV